MLAGETRLEKRICFGKIVLEIPHGTADQHKERHAKKRFNERESARHIEKPRLLCGAILAKG